MSEKQLKCPDCGERVRPCNLARHRQSHLPNSQKRGGYVYFTPARRPLLQHRDHTTRYDAIAPRGEGMTRFRIYRLRGGELQLIAGAPSPGNFGHALYDLHEKGEFIPDDSVGVLDTKPDPGTWIIHPFALGRTRSPK